MRLKDQRVNNGRPTFMWETKVANRCLIANTQHISHNQRRPETVVLLQQETSKLRSAADVAELRGKVQNTLHQYSEILRVKSLADSREFL